MSHPSVNSLGVPHPSLLRVAAGLLVYGALVALLLELADHAQPFGRAVCCIIAANATVAIALRFLTFVKLEISVRSLETYRPQRIGILGTAACVALATLPILLAWLGSWFSGHLLAFFYSACDFFWPEFPGWERANHDWR